VEVLGKGQPILLFPEFTSIGKVYKDITEIMSEDYEVHIFTYAGFGGVPAI